MDKSSSLGMPTHPKKYPRGTSIKAWGCPRGTPSSSAKIRSPFNILYFYCFMHCAFFLERLYFSFQFYFVFLAAINGWTLTNFFWWSFLAFHLPRTLCFSLLSFNECSLFLELCLAFIFLPWFLFRSCFIFVSRCILTSGPCWLSSKKLFQKGSNGVGKEKKFHAKKWYKKELV
jgi:hypothetical protein